RDVDGARQLAAIGARERDCAQPQLTRRRRAREDVRRASARGDRDRYVARRREPAQLAREDVLEAEVVRDRGDRGGVVRQRQRRKGAALALKAPKELGGDVRRIARASAVAEQQHLVAG